MQKNVSSLWNNNCKDFNILRMKRDMQIALKESKQSLSELRWIKLVFEWQNFYFINKQYDKSC